MSKGSNHRSSGSGQFVTAGNAAKNPNTTVKEPRSASKDSPSDPYRSASTGRYVTDSYGKANPGKVVREK